MASRLAGAPDVINRLTSELYTRILRGEISRVEVMFGHYHQAATATIERHLLLPLDMQALAPTQPRQAPLHNLEPRRLIEKLMAEYVFALLTGAAVELIASENVPRDLLEWSWRAIMSPRSFRNCAKPPIAQAKRDHV